MHEHQNAHHHAGTCALGLPTHDDVKSLALTPAMKHPSSGVVRHTWAPAVSAAAHPNTSAKSTRSASGGSFEASFESSFEGSFEGSLRGLCQRAVVGASSD